MGRIFLYQILNTQIRLIVAILFLNYSQVSLSEETEVKLEGTSYCPPGSCKGYDVRNYYPDPEVAKVILDPSFFSVPVPPNLNNDWSRMAAEIDWIPRDSDFRTRYSKSVGVCSNDFTHIIQKDKDYSKVFDIIKNRIAKDTGYEGEKFEIREPENLAERDGDYYVWKDNNVTNLTGVKMIVLNGNLVNDSSLLSGFINVNVVYDNYEDCRKEDPRLPEIPDPRMKFNLD
jgi:hypothetical protein